MTQFQPANTITVFDAAHGVLMWEACIFSARLSVSITHRSLPKPEPSPTAGWAAGWERYFPRVPGFCHSVLTNSSLSGSSKRKNTAELWYVRFHVSREQSKSAAACGAWLLSCFWSGNTYLWCVTLSCNLSDYRGHKELYIAILSHISVHKYSHVKYLSGHCLRNKKTQILLVPVFWKMFR